MRSFNHLLGHLVPTLALVCVTGLGACATGGGGGGGDDDESEGRPDARPRGDADQGGGGDDDPFQFPPDADPGTGGATPDAAPATPAACETGTWTSIGANGNFDGDPIVWSQFSKAGTGVIVNSGGPITPPSPARYAWLGGYNNGSDQVYQPVSVPANVGGLRVSGKVCIATQETNHGAFDLMGVTLHDAGTKAQLEPALKVFSNLDAVTPCGFKDFTAEAKTPHGGRDLIVVIGATTDPTSNTNFFLDSVKIEAMVCP